MLCFLRYLSSEEFRQQSAPLWSLMVIDNGAIRHVQTIFYLPSLTTPLSGVVCHGKANT